MFNGPGLVIAVIVTLIGWSGLKAIVRRRTVLRPRYSQRSDGAHTITGNFAVAIGIAQIILAVAIAWVWFGR